MMLSYLIVIEKRSAFLILYCCCRRASMELPLAVRFKQLKATSKETVGVYRLDRHCFNCSIIYESFRLR